MDDTLEFEDHGGDGAQEGVKENKKFEDECDKSNLFNLDSKEIQEPIPKRESDSKFFEPNEEKNMVDIKKSLVKGLKKGIPLRTVVPKTSRKAFKKKGRNLEEIKIQFLDYLSKLTSNHTKEQGLELILKLFESTAKDKDCLKIFLQQLLAKKLAKK